MRTAGWLTAGLFLSLACVSARDAAGQPPTLSRPATGRNAGEERDDNVLKMKFVWCPPGAFTMGSPPEEAGPLARWEKQVPVTLTRGFWLGKYEVTQAQWRSARC